MKNQEYKKIIIGKDEVIPVAERMRKEGRYLVMIHAFFNKDGEADISYDYAVDPAVESYHVIGEMKVPSISEIYDTAASWPERELNELWASSLRDWTFHSACSCPKICSKQQGKGQILVMPLKELVDKT